MNHTYYEGEKGAEDSRFDGNTFQYIGYNIMQFLLLVVTFGLPMDSQDDSPLADQAPAH
ncbi:hypothetical protein ACXO2Q_03820 [Lactobacillus delbrueckii subsp. bulgaricus]